MDRNTLKKTKDIKVKRGLVARSDHYSVMTTIKKKKDGKKIDEAEVEKMEYRNVNTYIFLQTGKVKKNYKQIITERINTLLVCGLIEGRNIDEFWDIFRFITTGEICGVNKNR